MSKAFSLKYSLDTIAALLALAGILGVLQTFIIGKHYIIPTALLTVTILIGNIARAGYRDNPLAKQVLFWLGVLLSCHTFFALFWAHTPREVLGTAFYPVYATCFVVFTFLTWRYAGLNRIFNRQ